jgi:hypothetical protein
MIKYYVNNLSILNKHLILNTLLKCYKSIDIYGGDKFVMYLHFFLECVLLQYPYPSKMCVGCKTIKTYQLGF